MRIWFPDFWFVCKSHSYYHNVLIVWATEIILMWFQKLKTVSNDFYKSDWSHNGKWARDCELNLRRIIWWYMQPFKIKRCYGLQFTTLIQMSERLLFGWYAIMICLCSPNVKMRILFYSRKCFKFHCA